MADQVLLTVESKAELEKRLEELKGKGRAEMAAKIAEARSFGDLSENAEYDLARDEQAKMEREISDLENAKIIENVRTDTVGVGSTVSFAMDGTEYTYQIVGSQDSDPMNGKISNDSPIGKALIGHRKGDVFAADIKVGAHVRKRQFKITEIH